jgi:glycosyltransferase involved in cell wall biosynthesis
MRILIASDSPFVHTGFSQQARHIAMHLAGEGHEVSYLAWFSNGWKRAAEYVPVPFDTYSTTVTHRACEQCKSSTPMLEHVAKNGDLTRYEVSPEGKITPSTNRCTNIHASRVTPEDKYGLNSFTWAVQMTKPDIVLTVGDIWMVESYTHGPFRKNYTLVCYMPVDGDPWPTATRQSGQLNNYGGYEIGWVSTLANIDRIVGYTQYGANVINDRMGGEKCTDYIWHGCDTHLFYPMDKAERRREKVKYFQREGVGRLDGSHCDVAANDIVITNTSRNQPRKGYPILFEAFSKFRERTDKQCWLYCHAAVFDFGWNFDDLAERFGISDAVIVNEGMGIGDGVTDEDMRLVYNISTVTVLPTRGEGWGLGLSESMACGIPCIATAYSGHGSPGGWGIGAFEEIKIKAMDTEPVTGIDRAVADIDDCADAIERALEPQRYNELIALGKERIAQCEWSVILPQWSEVVNSTELARFPYPEQQQQTQTRTEEVLDTPCAWQEQPLVSIVVPSSIILNRKNYDEVLKQCITSMDQQTYNNWELVLIDNVSYGQAMVNYIDALKHTVVRWPFKYRPSKVLNRAVAHS